MKRLLLLGGGHSEIPLIAAAKRMGYYVITTGNQAEGLGHAYGDCYINCDFSDKEAIYKLAVEQKADAICSGCNDFAYLSAAYACDKLGIPGHDSFETARKLHHKSQYRLLAESLGIITPKAKACENLHEAEEACQNMEFPVIVKPIDLTGGKGMKRCETLQDVRLAYEAAKKATREPVILVEEFVRGTNHGFSAYIQNKKVTFYFVDNEQYYRNPYLVSGASAPGDVPEDSIKRLVADCELLADNLNLADGILHIQFILKEDKTTVIIEICRRAPGDLYVKLVSDVTGIDYPAYIVAGETGQKMPEPKAWKPDGYYVRHCVMGESGGYLKGVKISEEIQPYIYDRMMWYKAGEEIKDVLKYKAGILFLHFPEEDKYRKYIGRLTELIKIEV